MQEHIRKDQLEESVTAAISKKFGDYLKDQLETTARQSGLPLALLMQLTSDYAGQWLLEHNVHSVEFRVSLDRDRESIAGEGQS